MGIYHGLKKAAKGVYKAATTPTVVVVEKPQPTKTIYVERVTPPPTRTVYVERHTNPTPPPVRTVYVSESEPVETRAFRKLTKIEMLSHYHSYSDEYDYDTWDALKRFGRALTNIYTDGYTHRIAVSVESDEARYIRVLINALGIPVVKDNHSAYRRLAQEFLCTYRAYL
jgi:hypothetical protein